MPLITLAQCLFVACAAALPQAAPPALTIQTSGGTIQGHINNTTPGVRRWLGVHYAQPPTGAQRWLPPVALKNPSSVTVDGSKYSVSCPQYEEAGPGLDFETREFLYTGPTGEDCLSLSIYAPLTPTNTSLPVFIWIHGGSLQVGGSTVPYEDPSKWVQRTQSHIVVGVQYRLNIFGYPNAPGLNDQNLGFLDQRMGIEWVRDNIARFGGDVSRMILFGQSAGGASTDSQNFAFPNDPIVSGFMPISGSAEIIRTGDKEQKDFAAVAEVLNCKGTDVVARLACMRQIPFEKIVQEIKTRAMSFAAVPDEKIVFQEPLKRLQAGKVSDRPVLYTTTLNEGIGFVNFPADPVNQTPDLKAARDFTLSGFTCPAASHSAVRKELGLPTWRYEYRGNFTNISRRPWVGAWHSADLPAIFGTSGDYVSPATPFQTEVSMKMQDFLLEFARDSRQGLEKAGWDQANNGKLMAFATNADATGHGGNTEGVATLEVDIASVDEACKGVPAGPQNND